MADRIGVYLAGPLGFTVAGRHYQESVLYPALKSLGVTVLDPWPAAARIFSGLSQSRNRDSVSALAEANHRVGASNEAMIRECAAVFAILDGSDVDSGTASEVGFAASLPRPVIGLRTDLRLSGDNEATRINLQLAYFVDSSGGVLVESLDAAVSALRRLLNL